MQVNSTASYSPSYTANYGSVHQAKSKAATKVTYRNDDGESQKATFDAAAKANNALAQKVGRRLNAKA